MGIMAILVVVAVPKFMGNTKAARLSKIRTSAKEIESSADRYYLKEGDWPRLTENDDYYTKEELESYAKEIYDKTGLTMELDENGKYYDIDFVTLKSYVKVPDNSIKYIIQNPVGIVYYLDKLTPEGEKIFLNENKKPIEDKPEDTSTNLYLDINRGNEAINIYAYPNTSLYGIDIFDNDLETSWRHNYSAVKVRYIKWQMETPRVISKLRIYSGEDSQGYLGLSTFRFYGSTTGEFNGEEKLLYSGTNIRDNQFHSFEFINMVKYGWYKLEGDWSSSGNGEANRCYEVELYELNFDAYNPPTVEFTYLPNENIKVGTKMQYNISFKDKKDKNPTVQEWKLNDGPAMSSPPECLNEGDNKLSFSVMNSKGIWSATIIKNIYVLGEYSNVNLRNEAKNVTAFPTEKLYGTAIFDGNYNTSWSNDYIAETLRYIKWQMETPRAISKLKILSGANTIGYTGLSTFRFYGSNTGEFNGEEVLLYSGKNIQDNNLNSFDFYNAIKYNWYKLEGDWNYREANRCYEVELYELN